MRCFHIGAGPVTRHHTRHNGTTFIMLYQINVCLKILAAGEPKDPLRLQCAMFNTSRTKAVLWPYHPLTSICINRVSMPHSWLSSLLPHFPCSHLAPVHLFRMYRLGPSYLLVLIARMFSLSTVSWLYFITFFWLKRYLIGDSSEIISHGLTS